MSAPSDSGARPAAPQWLPLALIALGLTLLGLSWSLSSPAFSVPDEAPHYLRALSISEGALIGPKAKDPQTSIPEPLYSFANHDSRAVEVPAALAPGNEACANGKPDTHGCIEVTPVGDYYPPAYVLPAVVLKFAGSANTALWLSRVVSLLLCLALIAAGLGTLWDGESPSLLGALAALTPMVLFVCSILNPSGLEIAANFAFLAALLRVSRDAAATPRATWVLLGVSGVLTILSFQSGPVSAAIDLAVAAALFGVPAARELGRRRRRAVGACAGALVAALVLWLIYSRVSGVAHSQFDIHPFLTSLRQGVDALVGALKDAVGTFGSLTVPLPAIARWLWWLGVAGLGATALALGDRRQRVALVGASLVVLAYPIFFYAWLYRLSGYALQGRQVLPLFMVIPLVSGEIVFRHRARLDPRVASILAPALIAGFAAFQAYAWWYNGKASAGAPNTLRFYAHATWSPPLGWGLWIAMAIAGTLATLAAAASSARR